MARAKRASDEIYNARRRAKRLLARLEREGTAGMSSTQASARADYIASVRASIAESYQTGANARTPERAKFASEKLDRMTKTIRAQRTRKARNDALFARQINLARIGAPNMLGEHSAEKVEIFYAATRQLWRGREPRRRNEFIVRGLGASSLSDAYDMVLAGNQKAIDYAVGRSTSSYVDGLTSENEDFYSEVEMDAELMGSVQWTPFLHMFG